jgi:hypothetical protein
MRSSERPASRSPGFAATAAAGRTAVASLLAAAWALGAATVLAASPDPTSAPAGDPRSSGQGPGLVGDPLFAIAVVAAIALVSLAVTLAYVRLTGSDGGPGPRP